MSGRDFSIATGPSKGILATHPCGRHRSAQLLLRTHACYTHPWGLVKRASRCSSRAWRPGRGRGREVLAHEGGATLISGAAPPRKLRSYRLALVKAILGEVRLALGLCLGCGLGWRFRARACSYRVQRCSGDTIGSGCHWRCVSFSPSCVANKPERWLFPVRSFSCPFNIVFVLGLTFVLSLVRFVCVQVASLYYHLRWL